jgi:hypothetical protein
MHERLWHPPRKFPVPEVKLLVRLTDDTEVEAVRPNYALSYQADPKFYNTQTLQYIPIKEVKEWTLR